MASDRAGRDYWEALWSEGAVARPIDPADDSRNNVPNKRLDEIFRRLFAAHGKHGARLLEVGAANSRWLPYFARQFGFEVTGIDYARVGCERARAALRAAGVPGRVVECDLFAVPAELVKAFNVILSLGVVEHFDDTEATIAAIKRLARPGALIVTVIPNMLGMIGFLQRTLNRPVYEIHKPLTPVSLRRAHESVGLDVLECDYFLSSNFGVLNLNGLNARSRSTALKAQLLLELSRLSKLVWMLESLGPRLPTSRWLSPYILCACEERCTA
jgi:2-polyprenyl-3-methyl-5-hydroxy-6-metoxy-1,4-benzoquinol methylase